MGKILTMILHPPPAGSLPSEVPTLHIISDVMTTKNLPVKWLSDNTVYAGRRGRQSWLLKLPINSFLLN